MTQKATSLTPVSVPRQTAPEVASPTAQPSNADRLNALLNPVETAASVGVDQGYLDACIASGGHNFEDTFGPAGGLLHDLVGDTLSADKIEDSLASAVVDGLGGLGAGGGEEFDAFQKAQLLRDLQEKAGTGLRAGQYGDRIACGISKHPETALAGLAAFVSADSEIDLSRERKLSDTLTAKGGVNLGSTLNPGFNSATAGLAYANTWESEPGKTHSTQAALNGEYNRAADSWTANASGSIVRDWGHASVNASHTQVGQDQRTQAEGSVNYQKDKLNASLAGSFGLVNGDVDARLQSSVSKGENTYGLTGSYQENAYARSTQVGASHSHRSDDLITSLSGNYRDTNGSSSASLQGSFQSGTGVGTGAAKTVLSGDGSVSWSEDRWNAAANLAHTKPLDGGWQRTVSGGFAAGSDAQRVNAEYGLERDDFLVNLKAASDFSDTTVSGALEAKDGAWGYNLNGSQSTSGDGSIGAGVTYNPSEDLSLSATAKLQQLQGQTAAEIGLKGALTF